MIEFMVVVFPQAVPPQRKKLRPYCRHNQRYAAMLAFSVPHLINWVTLMGVSVNRRMVILGPLMLTAEL
jgi:hypothetical protein